MGFIYYGFLIMGSIYYGFLIMGFIQYPNLPKPTFLWVVIINPNIDFVGTLQKSRFWRVKVWLLSSGVMLGWDSGGASWVLGVKTGPDERIRKPLDSSLRFQSGCRV